MAAVENGRVEVVKLLLARGAPVSMTSHDKLTALQLAHKLAATVGTGADSPSGTANFINIIAQLEAAEDQARIAVRGLEIMSLEGRPVHGGCLYYLAGCDGKEAHLRHLPRDER
jgi:hypothetical protein